MLSFWGAMGHFGDALQFARSCTVPSHPHPLAFDMKVKVLQQWYLAEFSCCGKACSVVTFKDSGKYILCDFAVFKVYFEVTVFRKNKP